MTKGSTKLHELEAALFSGSLRKYLEAAWPLIEPVRPFLGNWHIDAICDHLQAVTRGEIKRLVINVPPGSSKSILTGVMWPSWAWTHSPHTKWITSSYAENVARRDAMRAQVIMQSGWYQARWGHVWAPTEWTSMRYGTNQGGLRLALTVGGSVTGDHADHQLVDDPIKPLEASGAALDTVALQKVLLWWHETMSTRMTDPITSTRTIIMQRLHDRDLSGEVLAGGDYTHLNLPMRYERKCVVSVPHPCTLSSPEIPTPIGYKDPRTEAGQLLWPERFPEELQAMRLKEMGSRAVAAQDQQRPVPAGGGILKPHWFRTWHTWPKQGSTLIQSWDLAFKGASHNDDVVGQVWARKGSEFFLLDQISGKMNFSETCRAIIALSQKWPKALRKLVEDAANGPAVIDALSKTVPGLTPVKPIGGKAARAHAIEALVEAGNVYIPSVEVAPWVPAFLGQIEAFSGQEGGRDDMVDTATQALNYLATKSTAHYKTAMERAMADPASLIRR